jgi:hypothetical protein
VHVPFAHSAPQGGTREAQQVNSVNIPLLIVYQAGGWVVTRQKVGRTVGVGWVAAARRAWIGWRKWLLQQVQPPCVRDGLRAAVRIQLGVEMIDVPLDGADRHDQALRDFLIGQTLFDQAQYFTLAVAE